VTVWRCMFDGASKYTEVEATSTSEAAETFAVENAEYGDSDIVRVIVLDPEADADDESDERYTAVSVQLTVEVVACAVEVRRP
jgi:hypothetical protein